MKIMIAPGGYVAAVSGGVDSIVLLDLLRLHPGLRLTVAHYDHGIRDDSAEDRKLVQHYARRYGLPYVYETGHLGAGTSEAAARTARYEFLRTVKRASGAQAIVTAHHQDDVLETMLINLLRGTGRKGLSSLTSGEGIIRPLLEVPKTEIIDYARRHNLVWREDSTNNDLDYMRNRLRHTILKDIDPKARVALLHINEAMRQINEAMDTSLGDMTDVTLQRQWFIDLPHTVAKEVMAFWLRSHGVRDFSSDTLERLTVAAKIAEVGRRFDVARGYALHILKDNLALEHHER